MGKLNDDPDVAAMSQMQTPEFDEDDDAMYGHDNVAVTPQMQTPGFDEDDDAMYGDDNVVVTRQMGFDEFVDDDDIYDDPKDLGQNDDNSSRDIVEQALASVDLQSNDVELSIGQISDLRPYLAKIEEAADGLDVDTGPVVQHLTQLLQNGVGNSSAFNIELARLRMDIAEQGSSNELQQLDNLVESLRADFEKMVQ